MILPAAGLDGLTSLDIQQPGPLIDHLLKMPQGQLHGLGRSRDVTPGPAVVLALSPGESDLAGVAVPQLDPGLQNLPGSGGGLVDHVEEELFP